MDACSDVLLEELIDCNEDEAVGLLHSSWTEQALDLFISLLKNAKKDNFSNERKMLEVISVKMSKRGYKFSIDQIEGKYNSLKKMYQEKKEKNQTVEPELSKLFGDSIVRLPARQEQLQPPSKKIKREPPSDRHTPPKHNTSAESTETIATSEENDEKKPLWPEPATRLFLDLLEELRPTLGSKLRTKKQMWEEICCRMKTHGLDYSVYQVENKWKALLRQYRGRLELMRKGGRVRGKGMLTNPKNKEWPEFFDSARQRVAQHSNLKISFANDQSLPYDDDGYTDEEPYEQEAASPQSEVEIVLDESETVLVVEDLKPTQQMEEPSTSHKRKPIPQEQEISQLDAVVKEISGFREENKKYQDQMLTLKEKELKAYEERTEQFTRIADSFGELMGYLKERL